MTLTLYCCVVAFENQKWWLSAGWLKLQAFLKQYPSNLLVLWKKVRRAYIFDSIIDVYYVFAFQG